VAWITVIHQIGGASVAYLAGVLRIGFGSDVLRRPVRIGSGVAVLAHLASPVAPVRAIPPSHAVCTAELRITPPACRASPISEGVIEGAAAGTPDPVSRHRRPPIVSPPAVLTV
jgi:hypothetical protein